MSLPPVEIPLGAMRFNSDSQKLEYFNGQIWMQIHTFNPDLNGGPRGIFAGGANPGHSNMIQAFNISTQGNAFDFGNLSSARYYIMGCSSRTRAVWGGGNEPGGYVDTIEFNTIASTGDAVAFGELVGTDRHYPAGLANQTRGLLSLIHISEPTRPY